MMFFIYWTLYVLIGLGWLYVFNMKPKNKDFEFNVIGSLFIVSLWPFHVIYDFFRK